MSHSKGVSTLSGRSESNINDVISTFNKFGFSIPQILEYIDKDNEKERKGTL